MKTFQIAFKSDPQYKLLIEAYPEEKKQIRRAFMYGNKEFIVEKLHDLSVISS